MPYKPKKQTPAHKKQLERVRQLIRRAEKRGFRFTDDFKASLKDLKTVQLKALKPEKLYSLSTALSETGDIISGTERRREERSLSAKKSAQTRKKKKQQKEQEYYPDGGEIIFHNIFDEYISRISAPSINDYERQQKYGEKAEKLIENLQSPVQKTGITRDGREFRKPEYLIQESETQKNYLLQLTLEVAREIGLSALGWRLEASASDVDSLVQYILYGSRQAIIQSASTELASIINNGPLTGDQHIMISEQEEYNEDWELPE